MLLIRTDTACNVLWSKTYGGNDWDLAYSIINLPDSGFMFCGETYSNSAGKNDGFICRVKANGDTLWTRTIGGINTDVFYSIDSTNNHNFYVGGTSDSYGATDLNAFYVKISIDGDTLWSRFMGGGGQNEIIYSIASTVDQGLIMGGVAYDTIPNSINHHYLLRVDSVGNYLWHENPFWLAKNDEIRSVVQRSDSTIAYTGYTENFGGGGKDVQILYLNNDQSVRYGTSLGDLYSENANNVIFTTDGGCIVTGTTEGGGLYTDDIYLAKLDSGLNKSFNPIHFTSIKDISDERGKCILSVYPNPAESWVQLLLPNSRNIKAQCYVYNLIGSLILIKPISFIEGKASLQVSKLVPDEYFISVQSSGKQIGRCLLLKK